MEWSPIPPGLRPGQWDPTSPKPRSVWEYRPHPQFTGGEIEAREAGDIQARSAAPVSPRPAGAVPTSRCQGAGAGAGGGCGCPGTQGGASEASWPLGRRQGSVTGPGLTTPTAHMGLRLQHEAGDNGDSAAPETRPSPVTSQIPVCATEGWRPEPRAPGPHPSSPVV